VINANTADGGSRRFILVQIDEPTEDAEYPTIADVCRQRVKQVIANTQADGGRGDLAFNYYVLR
jgi:adenine-specific DNA-methyltransferase